MCSVLARWFRDRVREDRNGSWQWGVATRASPLRITIPLGLLQAFKLARISSKSRQKLPSTSWTCCTHKFLQRMRDVNADVRMVVATQVTEGFARCKDPLQAGAAHSKDVKLQRTTLELP